MTDHSMQAFAGETPSQMPYLTNPPQWVQDGMELSQPIGPMYHQGVPALPHGQMMSSVDGHFEEQRHYDGQIDEFSGIDTDPGFAAEWLQQVDAARSAGHWLDGFTLAIIASKLRGPAGQWHAEHGTNIEAYDEWRALFAQAFCAARSREQLLWENFQACRQRSNEPLDIYARRKEDLALQLGMNAHEIKDHILDGLHPSCQHLAQSLAARQHESIPALIIDMARTNSENHHQQNRRESYDDNNRRVRFNGARRRELRCYGCGELGHKLYRCPRASDSIGNQQGHHNEGRPAQNENYNNESHNNSSSNNNNNNRRDNRQNRGKKYRKNNNSSSSNNVNDGDLIYDSAGPSRSYNNPDNNPSTSGRMPVETEAAQERRLLRWFDQTVKTKYQPKTANLMVRYNKLGSQFADFSNNVAFLGRCSNMMMVPTSHRVYNSRVRNTRVVVRLLDECSFRVMIADLEHNRRRKYQVMRNRERVELRLMEIMSPEDFEEVRQICHENREVHFADVKERQRKEYQDLLDEYKTHETKKNRRRRLDSHRTNGDSSASPGPADQGDQGDEGHETTKSSAANAIAASGREQTSPPSSAAAAAAAGPKNRDKGKDKEAPGTASVKPPKPQGNTTSTATTDQSRV